MAETRYQKDKKNKNRPKAGEVGYKSSIQKRSYAIKKVAATNENQLKLL